jgi:hypothetical protein
VSNPEYQGVSPQGTPPPVTPADSPSDPSGYASVTPAGTGPAPYSITAPLDDLGAMTDAAGALAGAGIVYPAGPRQAATAELMNSPQGFSAGGGTSGWDITPGYSGDGASPRGGWPDNPQPSILETPDQGHGSNEANTGTD